MPAISERKPHTPRSRPIDAHIGGRLRLRRTLMGFSQEKLAESVGLTFQQIQKYEKGANRIGASRLYQFARILEVPPSYFFDSMPEELIESGMLPAGAQVVPLPAAPPGARDPLTKRETLELVRAYYRINDASVRRRLFELVKSLSDTDATGFPTGSIERSD
ncbi:MAG TPA: helix-turn-helix transcriptional regulator [Candidatus Cybelea sp.]|nr:helix-turn-helix transcriptional regulator [Candidatus Cybelea sp.]